MARAHVAIVSRDRSERNVLAAAFDGAPSDWHVEIYDREPPGGADVIVYGTGLGPPGAITFDPRQPHAVLERVRAELAGTRGRAVVVTAPSGGLGTSSIAVHLAQCLAPLGDALFLDLDVCWGSGERLGFDGDAKTWAHGDGSMRSVAHPVPGGFRVALAPHAAAAEDVSNILGRACAEFRHVVVDAPRGPLLGPALERASALVVVIAPTETGARRAAVMLEDVPMELPRALVVNRLGPGGETTAARLAALLGRRVTLELPTCAALRDAEDDARLVTSPFYRWRRGVARLARAVAAA